MSSFPDNRLVLFPRGINARASLPSLTAVLADIGLIADELPPTSVNGMNGHYLVGDKFFEHVSFLGCSPHLALAPPQPGDDGNTEFCHIGIDCADRVKFLGGDNVRAPQCPQCKAIDEDWLTLMPRWQKAPEVFTRQCQQCGATKPLQMFNWRRTAAFSAVSVHIWGIHQSEAVPNDGLLNALETLTHGPWEYFYRISQNKGE